MSARPAPRCAPLTVGSLFAGIAGFDLAAASLGMETRWFVEWDADCQFWLAEHFPGRPIYGDITQVDWSNVEPVDVLCGGFPCQPASHAGKRAGTADDRWLWPEFTRAIRALRPRWVVAENVPGLLSVNGGRAFAEVLRDLAQLGYDAEWDSVSAADVGAPHKRERVWIVAYATDERVNGTGRARGRWAELPDSRSSVGHPEHAGLEGLRGDGEDRDEPGRLDAGAGRSACAPGVLPDWSDAVAVRGADGTCRLVPRRAVADTAPYAGDILDGEREAIRDEHGQSGGSIRGEEALAGPESTLRPLVDGLPHGLAGRAAAEEVEGWQTPRAGDAKQGPSSTEKHRLSGKDWMLSDEASDFGEVEAWPTVTVADGALSDGTPRPSREATGRTTEYLARTVVQFGGSGSLWPVTENEPGRVARLRAVGNAVVPACAVVALRRVLELAWLEVGPYDCLAKLTTEAARDRCREEYANWNEDR